MSAEKRLPTHNPAAEVPGERIIVALFAAAVLLLAWNSGTLGFGAREIVDGPSIDYWQALGVVITTQALAAVAGYSAARSYFRSTMADSERFGGFLGRAKDGVEE